MFGDYVFEKSSAQYAENILLFDDDNLGNRTEIKKVFSAHGFDVITYENDLHFRVNYEDQLKESNKKMAVFARTFQYIPYDIIQRMLVYRVSLDTLFPLINTDTLHKLDAIGLDLLSCVYRGNFDDLKDPQKAERYVNHSVYASENIRTYLTAKLDELISTACKISRYTEWFEMSEKKSRLDVLAAKYNIEFDSSPINNVFSKYIMNCFGKLSQEINSESPVLVSKVMDFLHTRSTKFILVVMDGMSEFDWQILSNSFQDIKYEKTSVFAMIPSVTSVSRQCLLAGKYPSQLMEPWKQSKEKAEFINCAQKLGFSNSQIGYERGYTSQFNPFVKCGAVIIMDIDEMVHAQKQERLGMFNDVSVLADQHKLSDMVRRFRDEGFDVYITADHGNTLCTGMGKLIGTGVEMETKSRRMLVLRDFADKSGMIEKYGLIDYPKYYLPKEYNYLICDIGDSFDAKNERVMTHGGISLDEVVVPFIKIKAVQKNG